jgi:hypothetical protein
MALALAGCAATSASRSQTAPPRPAAQAQTTHERPSPPSAPEPVNSAADSQQRAVLEFAERYINWTPETVAGQMQTLAAQSVGQARSAMELAAAQTAHDYELQQGGISNSGAVEAISPLFTGHNRYAVITRETTTATNSTAYQGLHPAWHLAIATVIEVSPGRWVLSGWQPQN